MKAWLTCLQCLLHGRLEFGVSGWWPALACTTFVTLKLNQQQFLEQLLDLKWNVVLVQNQMWCHQNQEAGLF